MEQGLNQTELFFAALSEKQLRGGVQRSTKELEVAILGCIDTVNGDPKPFRWTKSANRILATIERRGANPSSRSPQSVRA